MFKNLSLVIYLDPIEQQKDYSEAAESEINKIIRSLHSSGKNITIQLDGQIHELEIS